MYALAQHQRGFGNAIEEGCYGLSCGVVVVCFVMCFVMCLYVGAQ